MAMTQTTPMTKTFEAPSEVLEDVTVQVTATFNGKVYNGKRYINLEYRRDGSIRKLTNVWQDGRGWIECKAFGAACVKAFGLK